jgi:two-component system heavy metal sensor histidine kinase CusS
MIRRVNIRWRLTLWFAAAMSILLIGRSFWIYYMMERRLTTIADSELNAKLDSLMDLIQKSADSEVMSASLQRFADNQRDLQIEVVAENQSVTFQSQSAVPSSVEQIDRPPRDQSIRRYETTVSDGGDHRRVLTTVLPTSSGPVRIGIGRSMQAEQSEVWDFAMTLLMTLPLAIVAAFGVGYIVSSRALNPVDRMISTANDITANRLDQRIDVPDTGDELARLAQTLNQMIDRLNKSFEEMRRFTADAAHDLRTPVTALRTEVEVSLMADRTVEDFRNSMQTVLEEAVNLSRLTEQLLDLSREDHGMNPGPTETLGIDVVLQNVLELLHPVAQQKGVEIDSSLIRPLKVLGDQIRLRRVFMNLLSNAIQYSCSGGRVWINVESSPGGTTIVVSDNGPGIPAEDLPQIFDRFRRVDQARNHQSGGTGLGLAICKAIVESHGGTIRMESLFGDGTRVFVTLPAPTFPAVA